MDRRRVNLTHFPRATFACKTPSVNDRALSELRDLARRDAELAAGAAELRQRDLDVTDVRARAEAIDAFVRTYPDEDARRNGALGAAGAELARRRAELELADAERDALLDKIIAAYSGA